MGILDSLIELKGTFELDPNGMIRSKVLVETVPPDYNRKEIYPACILNALFYKRFGHTVTNANVVKFLKLDINAEEILNFMEASDITEYFLFKNNPMLIPLRRFILKNLELEELK